MNVTYHVKWAFRHNMDGVAPDQTAHLNSLIRELHVHYLLFCMIHSCRYISGHWTVYALRSD